LSCEWKRKKAAEGDEEKVRKIDVSEKKKEQE
jgi:hypothetical protein